MNRKNLTDKEWLARACSRDPARPVLNGICVRDGRMAATDGHRLHVTAADSLPAGIWDPKTWTTIEGTFPNFAYVIPEHDPARPLAAPDDLDEWLAVCAAAVAYARVKGSTPPLVTVDATVTLDARYLADILAATWRYVRDVVVSFKGRADGTVDGLHPVRFDFPSGWLAVLMPVRAEADGASRFGLKTRALESREWSPVAAESTLITGQPGQGMAA